MMLVSTSKFLALLALAASVAAAPASSSSSVSTTSDVQSSSRLTQTHSATTTKSTTTTTTPPLVANTPSNGIVTKITIGSLVKSSVSGSQVIVTSPIVETVTLYPQGGVSAPSVAPFTPTPAVTTSSQAATTTPTNVRTNGSPARIGGGMGLAAILGVAGVVAAVL